MAKRVVKWFLEGALLQVGNQPEDDKTPFVAAGTFDLSKIFPTYNESTDVQKYLIVYGVKQRLMDTGAGEKADAAAKIQNAKDTWAELLEGKVKGERANATGAAENKRVAAKVKEIAGVVSLEGLITKKMLYGLAPDEQKKLDELMVAAAQAVGKK